MMKRFICWLFIILVLVGNIMSSSAGADSLLEGTGSIVGKTSVEQATVVLYDSSYKRIDKTISDDTGNFIFENVPEGTDYVITAGKSGDYVLSSKKNINVVSGETTYVYVSILKGDGDINRPIDYSERPIITVGEGISCPGGKVDIPVTISNNTGIFNVSFELYYFSNKMRFESITKGDLFVDGELSYNNDGHLTINLTNRELIKENGEILTIKFSINDGINDDNLDLSLNAVSYTDENNEEKGARMAFGAVHITSKVYELSSISLRDIEGENIEIIPENVEFIINISLKKLYERDANDFLIVAIYDDEGALVSYDYKKTESAVDEECFFGFNIPQQDRVIGGVKLFVWSSLDEMRPLSATASKSF